MSKETSANTTPRPSVSESAPSNLQPSTSQKPIPPSEDPGANNDDEVLFLYSVTKKRKPRKLPPELESAYQAPRPRKRKKTKKSGPTKEELARAREKERELEAFNPRDDEDDDEDDDEEELEKYVKSEDRDDEEAVFVKPEVAEESFGIRGSAKSESTQQQARI